ncbi:MAG TPA: RsmD family RNA methyltransferase [Gemmatimonadales bacterium]|jgi:16S rRNA (guanine966-N2)-methyltransferase
MRIVGGRLAGRDLVSPQDQRVHPTAERTRAGAFDLLGTRVTDARVLDLFAGTGALGLEAISRGARSADFVEFRPDSLHALRANVAALGLQDQARIFKKDAIPFAEALDAGAYDLAFADPPYGSKMLDRIVKSWEARRFAAILVIEHALTHEVPAGAKRRVFEDSVLTVYGM